MTFQAAMYRGTPAGVKGIYNRSVRAWERGPYSHGELVFSDGQAASASFMDKGVRFKPIVFDPGRWDFIVLPNHLEDPARQWFEDHKGAKYDLMGNAHLVVGFIPHSDRRYFCSEAMAAALGIPDPWRFGPNALAAVLPIFNQPATAGFSIKARP